MNNELIRAIDLALAGQWEQAHNIVQQHETDRTASWIHAVLHKIEGDRANSAYWYRRAGQTPHTDDNPQTELTLIRNLTSDL